MIIDSHTHIGRNNHINASVDQLLTSMDLAGIDKSLVFAGEINDCPNYHLFKEISPYKDRLYGVAAVALDKLIHGGEHYREIQRIISSERVVAFKFYTGYEHFYPYDYRVMSVLRMLNERNIPAIFHCGDCLASIKKSKLKYAHPLGIDDVAVDFPNMKFIIAHMGNPWIIDTAEVCYKNENVWSDISGYVYGDFTKEDYIKFKKTINQFSDIAGSTDKLIFGSDWPISSQSSYMHTMTKLIDSFPFSKERDSMECILSNALKVFNIK